MEHPDFNRFDLRSVYLVDNEDSDEEEEDLRRDNWIWFNASSAATHPRCDWEVPSSPSWFAQSSGPSDTLAPVDDTDAEEELISTARRNLSDDNQDRGYLNVGGQLVPIQDQYRRRRSDQQEKKKTKKKKRDGIMRTKQSNQDQKDSALSLNEILCFLSSLIVAVAVTVLCVVLLFHKYHKEAVAAVQEAVEASPSQAVASESIPAIPATSPQDRLNTIRTAILAHPDLASYATYLPEEADDFFQDFGTKPNLLSNSSDGHRSTDDEVRSSPASWPPITQNDGQEQSEYFRVVHSMTQALWWAVYEDHHASFPDELVSRFALTVLYFHQGGQEWKRSRQWLSSDAICGPPGYSHHFDYANQHQNGTQQEPWEGVKCDLSQRKVQELDLANNGLTGHLAPTLALLTNLQVLWLNYNQLSGPVPEILGTIPHLTMLFLQKNSFTGSIPTTLNDNGALRKLFRLPRFGMRAKHWAHSCFTL
jgi:hypothetical protein